MNKRKDILLIAEEVRDKVVKDVHPRAHKAFSEVKSNIIQQLNAPKLLQWVHTQKKSMAKVHDLQTVKEK